MRKLNPVFLRYLGVLFLFSALLLIVFIPVYFYIFNFTLNNELTFIYNRFHWGVSSLDNKLAEVNNIAIVTNRDSRFRIFTQDLPNLDANPVLLNELRGHFNSLMISHPLIENAGIIFSRDLILTRWQIYYYPELISFYGNYIQADELSEDEWYSLISITNAFSPVMYFSSMGRFPYKGLSYAAQWGNTGIMYATFPVNGILSILADDEILSQSSIRVTNNYDEILYSYSGERWNPKDSYRTLSDKSEVTPAFFQIQVPESVISGKMLPVKRLMFAFALATIFFIICLSIAFAYKWSEPMRGLLLSIDSTRLFKDEYEQKIKQAGPGLKNYFRRIFTGISESINIVDTRLAETLRTAEGQTSLLREQIFYKALLQGLYSGQDEQLFRSLFVDFPESFQLALISCDLQPAFTFQETAFFQLQLINTVKSGIGNIFIHSIGDNIIILLLPLAGSGESWYERLRDLRNNLNQRSGETLHFSLSGIYEKPADLPRAWQELQSIRIASGIEALVSVVQIKDIPHPAKRMSFNNTTLQMIYNALSNGSDETACNILLECTAEITSEKDMFVMSLFINLLYNMLLLLRSENTVIDCEIPRYISGREDDLLNRQFPECFRRIGILIRQNKEEDINRFSSKILEYINQNMFNPALYSAMVQAHFNISQPTLQKLIKLATGHTFLSYVETCRLTKARELLLEGTYTVQAVSVKCGFSNTNSFYKAFKRVYGFPPGDIRANQR